MKSSLLKLVIVLAMMGIPTSLASAKAVIDGIAETNVTNNSRLFAQAQKLSPQRQRELQEKKKKQQAARKKAQQQKAQQQRAQQQKAQQQRAQQQKAQQQRAQQQKAQQQKAQQQRAQQQKAQQQRAQQQRAQQQRAQQQKAQQQKAQQQRAQQQRAQQQRAQQQKAQQQKPKKQRELQQERAQQQKAKQQQRAKQQQQQQPKAKQANKPAATPKKQQAVKPGLRDNVEKRRARQQKVNELKRKRQQQAMKKLPPKRAKAKPLPVAKKDVSKEIERARRRQTAVVSDRMTRAELQRLRRAERQRRERARERRNELIGAAAIGAVVGALIPALGGRVVIDQGDRFVVERNGYYYVRRDEGALFRDDGADIQYVSMPNGFLREIVTRRNGVQIITVRDPGGYIVQREKILPNGARIILYDAINDQPVEYVNYDQVLPPIQINIPQDEYIISGREYDRRGFAEAFLAPPVVELDESYTLREVRENQRLRDMVRRVDLDSITFESGSAYVNESQVGYLADIAGGMLDAIEADPQTLFLVEGHTDAVGDDLSNLTLSDRRAETVARILVDAYGVPPENLVVDGYGEQYLKIQTDGPAVENRRVTVRNISPLLDQAEG